jgi:DNA recombination protein RmuC
MATVNEPLLLLGLAVALAVGVALGLLLRRRGGAPAAVLAKLEERLALREEALTDAKREREEALTDAKRERDEALLRIEAASVRESDLRAKLVEAETRLAEEREQAAEKLQLLADAEKKLAEAFSNLAGRALEANAESFLRQAKQSFETLQTAAQGDLEQRRQSVEALVAPMREQLARYEQGVRELERARELAYGTLSEQVRALVSSQEKLQLETGNLVKALRAPQVRGRWGEMQLKRAVEFAGLVDHVDFVEQETTAGEDALQRPDMVVRLPGGKRVVVDAKAPLAAYLDALEARDEDVRLAHLADHARQVRDHVRRLASKAYWSQFDEAPDFVVLFLPGESFFSAALEQDPALIEEAFRQSVMLATPTTLVALLKSVAYGWRQEDLAVNARRIADEARTLYDRVRVFGEHLDGVGKGLEAAVKAHNRAAGSFSSRVVPQGRRLEELALGPEQPLAEPREVELAPRALDAGGGDEADDGSDRESAAD